VSLRSQRDRRFDVERAACRHHARHQADAKHDDPQPMIFSIAWSRDGQWLSLASGINRSDVVLMTREP